MEDRLSSEIWSPILRAVNADPQDVRGVRGISGLEHPCIALGLDEGQRRLIVISGEADARSAALAQADIQAAIPEIRVVVARPVAFDMAQFAEGVATAFGAPEFGHEQLKMIDPENQERAQEFLEPLLGPVIGQFAQAIGPMGFAAAITQGLTQLSKIRAETEERIDPESGATTNSFRVDVSGLLDVDPLAVDRDVGVCSIPLYALTEAEIELLSGSPSDDEVRELLRAHDVLQYFFPAPDQLALGLTDRAPSARGELVERVSEAPGIGHPFGAMELVDADTPLGDLVDALQDRGFLIEGEITQELSPAGQSTRASVRFSPKEGVVSKVLNRVTVKIDLSTKLFGE